MTKLRGFTLIEMLCATVIVAILTAIAIPGYQRHMARVERIDARALLYQLTSAQERFFIQHGRYAGTAVELGYPPPAQTANGKYQVAVVRNVVDGFTVRATRLVADAEAQRCLWFQLDQHQARASSPGSIEQCWMR